jgi:outer membrane biosynthesis protein TonB
VKLPEMKTGLAISAFLHAALLVWGLISFAAKPLEAKPNDALPVDIISEKQFSEMTLGVKNAPKDKPPAPLVEKLDTPKAVDDSSAKVKENKELDAAKNDAKPPPPPPEPEPKKAEAKPKPEKKEPPKIDPIAETLKKEEAKKKAEDKAKAKAAQTPPKPQPQFDPNKIAALLDKREPTRQASAGQQLSPDAGLGKSDGRSAQLSQSEIDALRRRLGECWNPPVGANAGQIKVVLRVVFKPDATVAVPPQLVAASAGAEFGPAMAESAKRAILTCQPFTMLRPEHYQQWKDIEITFDPREMFGG